MNTRLFKRVALPLQSAIFSRFCAITTFEEEKGRPEQGQTNPHLGSIVVSQLL
ncbi:hypothetical protein MTBSS4_200024 [Magnetospirillum sp. SS-4]|nr:hypothetical protein MTBSS4_200024 [Magnetospirillum sp. SS-4]